MKSRGKKRRKERRIRTGDGNKEGKEGKNDVEQ